jgi:hypothetical protein
VARNETPASIGQSESAHGGEEDEAQEEPSAAEAVVTVDVQAIHERSLQPSYLKLVPRLRPFPRVVTLG